MPGEEEMVEEMEEEEEEEEEGGLEYTTNTPSGGSYMTPPSTGGHSSPSPAPSHSPTPEEAKEDLEMNNLPPVENSSPLLVPAPVFLGFIPFAISTGQCCIPPKSLLRKVYHPYKDPIGQCRCEPDRKSTRLNSSHESTSRMPSSA